MAREIDTLKDQQRLRREALLRRVLDTLRETIQLDPTTPAGDLARLDSVRCACQLSFTDASARVIAPLVEAVDILEAIIFASDGCVGHRDCAHTMEPWQRARALLQGKWDAETDGREWPTEEKRLG